jgi:hypothetical protein
MPKQQLSVNLDLSPSRILQEFQRAAVQTGWQILSSSHSELVCQEVVNMPATHWPAKVMIRAVTSGGSGSQVTLDGTIAGFGPIQSNHLKQSLENLVEAVSEQVGQPLAQSTKLERGFWEKLGGTLDQFSGEYFSHDQFINQLLNMPPDQMQYALRQKVQTMDDRAFKGFYWSLIGMYLLHSGKAQNLSSAMQSSRSWGNAFEDYTAQFVAEMNYGGPSPEQRWKAQQVKEKANNILMLAHYAKQYRQR